MRAGRDDVTPSPTRTCFDGMREPNEWVGVYLVRPWNHFGQPTGRELSWVALAHLPNHVVSALDRPASVPCPTQATCPSGLTSTAEGAVTSPITGSSQTPE